jgi:hypothetical protein
LILSNLVAASTHEMFCNFGSLQNLAQKVLGSRQSLPPGALCAHSGEGFVVFFFRMLLCQGFAGVRDVEVPHTLAWCRGHFVGALCAKGGAGGPAFNVCWCFPGADHLVLGGEVGSDSVLGGW